MKAEDRLKELIENEEINSLDGATQEGFIKGWNEALRIHNVSQTLIDYMKWFDNNMDMYYEVSNKEMIEKYIKSINCG